MQRMQGTRRGMSRVNSVSEELDERDDDTKVLQVDGTGVKPLMMEGLMYGNKYQSIIVTGSPGSFVAVD